MIIVGISKANKSSRLERECREIREQIFELEREKQLDNNICVCPNICCANGDYNKIKQQRDNYQQQINDHKCPSVANSELESLRADVEAKEKKIEQLEQEIEILKDKPPLVGNKQEVERLLEVIVESGEVAKLKNKLGQQEKRIERLHIIYLTLLGVSVLVGAGAVRLADNSIIVNDRLIKYVGVSSHCDKHFEHGITREGIIEMVELLNTRYFPFSGKQEKNKNYFKDYPEKDNKSIGEKTKYQFSQVITRYLVKNNLSEAEIAQKLGLDKDATAKLLRGYVENFSLDSLIAYVEKLHLPLQVKITEETSSVKQINSAKQRKLVEQHL
ncbi:9012_t:CDS:2 [Cetraspora pellucida]|uniref:9012_t:CDS:1 n=1 Tax=Cetraspora pellucida TaxID=1433469 RepID=A0ACA9ND33_9GLOM|nr:9012_t:CDS:2 [Cetraspora pellucida]